MSWEREASCEVEPFAADFELAADGAARRVEARVAFGRFECSLEGPLDISLLSERFVPGAGGSPPQYETPPVIYSGHRCLRQQYVGTKDGALSI